MIYQNKLFRCIMNIIMILLIAACVLPFILLISSSFSSETDLAKYGYSLLFPGDLPPLPTPISGESNHPSFGHM